MENLLFDLDDLFNELKVRAREEGAFDREAWDDLAEALLEEKREWQEMDDDEAIKGAIEALRSRYGEFEEEVEKM